MAVAWEGTLPQTPSIDENAQTTELSTIPFETTSGRTRTRRRSTTQVERAQFQFDLSAAQLATWRTFYRDSLKGGAVPFTLNYPTAGGASTTFLIKTPPVTQEWGAGKYTLSFAVEVVA